MSDDDTFTDQAWELIAGWREAIGTMAFIRALSDGTLPEAPFTFYLAQDAIYLAEFARALSLASAQAPTPEGQAFYAGSAHVALDVESSLHRDWLADHAGPASATASPVTAAYTDHLLAVAARGSYPVLAAAVLPCYWLYAHIGSVITSQAGKLTGHPYERWISTYADPAFQKATDTARALADAAARVSESATRSRMLVAFERSSIHEYLFFQQGTHQAGWPTPETVG